MADNHKSPLRPEGEDLLQAALSDPFSAPNLPRVSPVEHASTAAPAPAPVSTDAAPPDPSDSPAATSPESSVSPAEFDAWKAEYESQVVEWRRQNATVRARAEAERARWEERRAHEQQQQRRDTSDASAGQLSRTSTGTSEWESVSHGSPGGAAPSGAPASAGAHVVAEDNNNNAAAATQMPATTTTQPNVAPPTTTAVAAAAAAHRPAPAVADPTGSPNWENLPSSPTSSFPSMSFPEPSRPHSPERATTPHAAPRAAGGGGAAAAPLAAAASATLAVFDDSLSSGTRFWALVTSLSVNMFLPFVNGVMLGFGEIFAKTVIVGWLGWGPAVATNVGLGVPAATSRRRWWS